MLSASEMHKDIFVNWNELFRFISYDIWLDMLCTSGSLWNLLSALPMDDMLFPITDGFHPDLQSNWALIESNDTHRNAAERPWAGLMCMMTSSNGKIFRVTGHLCGDIHRSPLNFKHKGQWHGVLMFSLICAWINGWVNSREAGDLRRHRAHYGATVMGVKIANGSHHEHYLVYLCL